MLSFHSNQTPTKVVLVSVCTRWHLWVGWWNCHFSIARHVWRCCRNEQYRQLAKSLILSSCSSSSSVSAPTSISCPLLWPKRMFLDIILPGFSLILLSLRDCSFLPDYTGHKLGIECRTSQMARRVLYYQAMWDRWKDTEALERLWRMLSSAEPCGEVAHMQSYYR